MGRREKCNAEGKGGVYMMMGLVLWKVNILKQYTAQPDDENLAAVQLLTVADLAINGDKSSRAIVHLLKHWI